MLRLLNLLGNKIPQTSGMPYKGISDNKVF